MPEPRDRHRPEELHEKTAEFREFRLLDQDDAAFFRKKFFADDATLDTCIAAIQERGYRNGDLPVLIMKFGNDLLRDLVLDRLSEYPDIDVAALLHAVPRGDDYSEHTVIRHIALRLEQYAAQDRFAERMLEDERSRQFFILNLPHLHDLSPEVARRLIDQGYRWAVLGHVNSFQPDSVDVPALISEMVVNSEMSEEVAQELVAALHSPKHFADLLFAERRSLLARMCDAGRMAERDKGARAEHEREQRELLLQAVPDRALFSEYLLSMGSGAAREAIYQIHAREQQPALARDLPGIMEDLFRESAVGFFAKDLNEDLFSSLLAGKHLEENDDEVKFLYETKCAIWNAERLIVMNMHLVRSRIDAYEKLSDHDRAVPAEEQSFLEALNTTVLATMSPETVSTYLPIAETIMGHPEFFLRVPSGGHSANDMLRRNAVGFFDAYADKFQNSPAGAFFFDQVFLSFGPDSSVYTAQALADATKTMVCAWHGGQRRRAAEKVLNLLDSGEGEQTSSLYAYLLYCTERAIRDRALSYFHNHGLPFLDASLIETWRQCSSKADGPDKILGEIRTMMHIEKERPGACTVLRKEFGIENYSRYPLQLLIEQYDTRDDHSFPYGVVINPKTDYNGGFRSLLGPTGEGKDPLNDLYEQVKGKYRTRVYEAGSKLDVVRQLIKIKRRYIKPSGKRISFLFIGGHGSPRGIRFGEGKMTARITIEDLVGDGVGKLGGAYFEPGATVILRSCSTGVLSGIGQQLSKVLGLKMIAPDRDTDVPDLSVDIGEDGELTFYVSYRNAQTMEYQTGIPVKEQGKSIPT